MQHERGLYPRREFLGLVAGGAAALFGCLKDPVDATLGPARLTARPGTPSGSVTSGDLPLGLGAIRDGVLHVPPSYTSATPMPLVLGLHGAGQNSQEPLDVLSALADEMGFLLLAVDSRGQTWDGVSGRFGADVKFLDAALKQTFARCAVRPDRVVLEGFSDGASYALGLGLVNGDLFGRLIAFSPGFIPTADEGSDVKPRVFVSHGVNDSILPIRQTSRVMVPKLKADGYDVTYQEFDGPHTVPPDIARSAATWMLA
jgi:predicted esterase